MRSASMYESSGSQFFRTTTGIQSGPDAFDGSWFIMTFLTSLVVIKILCSFRLVLVGKTGKEIPDSSRLEFLRKFLADNLLYQKHNTWNRGGIADLPLLRTLLAIPQKSWEPSFWEVMDSFVLVAYASLAALHWLLAYLNLTLDSEDLFCWYKQITGFTWYLRWWIYASISTWTQSQNSQAAAEALKLKISSHGTSLRWSWRLS